MKKDPERSRSFSDMAHSLRTWRSVTASRNAFGQEKNSRMPGMKRVAQAI